MKQSFLIPLLALTTVSADLLPAKTIEIRPAPAIQLPSPIDSNSPGHWWNGSFVLFNSEGVPYRNYGEDQFDLIGPIGVSFHHQHQSPLWIEATWMEDDGVLFAWYHHEPGKICPGTGLTALKIGAMVSYDNGVSFQDLGFILESGDCIKHGGAIIQVNRPGLG